MPLQRLSQKPDVMATIADITCDSDGEVTSFVGEQGRSKYLPLHKVQSDEDYYIGFFMIGAYQEILGDLHNLFGDTNAVHVSLDDGGYRIDHVVEGDTVTDVLGYVEFRKYDLVQKMRAATEKAVREGLLTLEESARLIRRYDEGLRGYTYLAEEPRAAAATVVPVTPRKRRASQPRREVPLQDPRSA